MKSKKFLAVVTAATMITANSITPMPDKFVNLPVINANAADIVASGECGADGDNVIWQLDSEGMLTISGTGEMETWETITDIPWYADYATSINKIIIENGVTNISFASFYGCKSLTLVKIPDSVTDIGVSAFAGCIKLTSIELPESIENIGKSAFENCSSLSSVILPDGIKGIGEQSFMNCKSLTDVSFPENVESIGTNAFYRCNDITSVTIENPDCVIGESVDTFYETVKIQGYEGSTAQAYAEKYNRTFVALDDEKPAVEIVDSGECGAQGDNATWTLDNNGTLTISGEGKIKCGWKEYINQVSLSSPIKKVIIDGNITEIGDLTFTFCDNLSEITIPETVTYIGESAFSFCSNLTSITIPDSVTSIGEDAFSYSGLNLITIPESITNIAASTFANCKKLTSVTLPDSITSIGLGAFSGCDKLKEIKLPSSLTTIGDGAFELCLGLEKIDIPKNVSNIGEHAFLICENLTAINVDENNEYYTSENDVLFNKEKTTLILYPAQKSDKKYIIPDTVTTLSPFSFAFNENLTEIEIPNTIAVIDENVFKNCSALAAVIIPETVKSIGESAFADCTKLTSITIKNPECEILDSEDTFSNYETEEPYKLHFDGTIYGYEDSTAQAYAEKYNRTFVALDDEKLVTTTTITTTSTSTTTTTTVAVEGNVSWQMPEITVEKGTEIIEVPVLLLDYDNSQLAVSSAEFTLTYDYNALDLVELTSKSDAYCTETIFSAAINHFSIEIGSGNAIAGEHLANVVVFRFRIKDMSLNKDYFIRIKNFCAYDANGRNISDHIKTNDGRIRLVEKITTTTTTSTTANSTTTTSTTTSTTTTTTPPVTTEPYFILGDINADGSVDSSDASLVLAEYAKIQTGGAGEFTKTQLESADVNNDNVVDSSDASKILAYYAMVSTGKKPTWD
ncbi:MAG: leucine-rich repeat protein [Ruminococcus sp.]|nr:leucine-rich repeat protein [Ruminococcus sp.]